MISVQKRLAPSGVVADAGPSAAASSDEQTWTQRKFFKKTMRGRVQKIVRERYLRDDVLCGRSGCSLCARAERVLPQRKDTEAGTGLDEIGAAQHDEALGHHIVILDTNVVLHQIDFLESTYGNGASNATLTNVVVLQTVLDEVRHRSLPLLNRLQAIIREPERRWWVYWNEFSKATATVRTEGESPNDRNDRSIRTSVKWYRDHLDASLSKHAKPIKAILLSDDADNVAKARQDGLVAMSVHDYVSKLPASSQLLDLLASRSGAPRSGAGERETAGRSGALYSSHLDASTVAAGLASGNLKSGFFNANPYNYLEATVRIADLDQPVLLVGREAMNRAIDGDIVAIEVLPKEQWKHQADEILEVNDDDPTQDDAEDGDDSDGDDDDRARRRTMREEEAALRERSAVNAAGGQVRPTGRVVGIVKRNWRSYVAHIDANSVSVSALSPISTTSLFVIPLDRRIPRIRIRTRQASALLGQKILVALDEWKETSKSPEGHFVRALGAVESKEAEQESLLLEHDIPYRPFSQAILNCLPPEGDAWIVPPKDDSHPAWRGRRDLRDEMICSIDPPGCQDIDDALHAKRLPNGNIQAGVHIADVSYFVRPDTPMDREAASRGTTVYLVDKRIDMLPHLLGTNLCSLRPHVERLAFSVLWEMTEDGDTVDVQFFKSVIASKEAFTYEDAQKRKDDAKRKDPITESIRLLNHLALKLKERRHKAGALNLASPEVRIHLDSSETSAPIDVEQKEMRETNSLVEEFMLLANIAVARRIYQFFPQTAVLRRHMPPPATNFETLQAILKIRRGLDLDVSSSGALAASLDKCVDPDEPTFNTLVRIMATRCMLSAEYFCAGSVAVDTFGHYGLACDMYTHFTSPIRRMADVLTHRQLAASIEYESLAHSLHSKAHVEAVLHVVNKRHRAAQMAGRASVEYWVGQAIKRRNEEMGGSANVGTHGVHLVEDAFVIRAFRNGVAVFVNKYGLEGVITFDKDCAFDADAFTVTVPAEVSGLAKDLTLGIFDRCKVEIGVQKDKSTQRSKTKMALVL